MKSQNENKKQKKEKQLRTDIDQEETELDVLKYFEEAGFSTKSSEEYNGDLNAREFPDFEEETLDPMLLFKW